MHEEHNGDQAQIPQSIDDILNARNQLDRIIQDKFTKDLSVLFTDICGYTKFMETRGDLAGRAMLQQHNEIVIQAIISHNGEVIKTIGDAVMAIFHESIDGVAAAVAVQEGLYRHNQKVGKADSIHVKIGLHHGQVLMDNGDIFGDVVNLAARIQAMAGPDEILLSQSIHDGACVHGRFDCSFLGAFQVKGKAEPQNIYRIIWSSEQKKQTSTVQVRSRANMETTVKESRDASSDTVLPLGITPSIHIDASIVDNRLILSCFEQTSRQIGTVQVYEQVEFKADHVADLCKVMVNTLNMVNRLGVFPPDSIEKLRQTGQKLQISLLTHKIMNMLSSTLADHLIVLLDEALIHIPWELIHDGKEFLCRRFSMGRLIKTSQKVDIHQGRSMALPIKMLIIADPEKNLDGADREGGALELFLRSKQDNVNIFRPREAVTSKFLLDNLHYYDWVHFAGHTQYNVEDPAMNGWCLADNLLHARDIMEIARERPMPALVFSNSCQSARSEEEKIKERFQSAIYSMAKAMLLSGVHHYIGTFWEINDEYSHEFAMSCYQGLLAGRSIGGAIMDARRDFVEAHGENTVVWGSYLLYGDPRVSYFDQTAHGGEAELYIDPTDIESSSISSDHANIRVDLSRRESAAEKTMVSSSRILTRLPFYLGVFAFILLLSLYFWHSQQ